MWTATITGKGLDGTTPYVEVTFANSTGGVVVRKYYGANQSEMSNWITARINDLQAAQAFHATIAVGPVAPASIPAAPVIDPALTAWQANIAKCARVQSFINAGALKGTEPEVLNLRAATFSAYKPEYFTTI